MGRIKWIVSAVLVAGLVQAAETVFFNADFDSVSNGPATVTALNAGTTVGAWTADAELNSYVTNGILHAGNGLYNYRVNLAENISFSGQPVIIHFEFQSAVSPASNAGFSTFILKDDADRTLLSFRTPNAGSLQVFPEGGPWTTLATGNAGTDAAVPDAMNTLSLVLTDVGVSVVYNGAVATTSPVSYRAGSGASLGSVLLTGTTDTISAMWYDSIRISAGSGATLSLVALH